MHSDLCLHWHFQSWPQVNANLTLGQCQIRWNCVKMYIIRIVLIGQGCLYYFVVTLDQYEISTNHTDAPLDFLVIYTEKLMTPLFLLVILRSSTHRRWKPVAYLESWGHSEQETCVFLCKNIDLKIWLFWPDLDLTSVKSQVGWRHRAKWLKGPWMKKIMFVTFAL